MHAWLYIQFSTIIASIQTRNRTLLSSSPIHAATSLSLSLPHSLHIYIHSHSFVSTDECNSESLKLTHSLPSESTNSAKMRRPLLLLAAVVLFAATTTTSAFNITILLGLFPGFEQFNQLLTRTQLAEQVNSRRTITVLGLPNDRIGTLMQLPEDVQKSILSLHIILDYFDMAKLAKLTPANKTTLTTLYQSSGVAIGQQGFIDVVRRRDGTIVFGSSVPGSPQVCNFINPVASQPFNISVLSVSQPIIAPGMDGTYVEAAPATPPPPPTAAAPAPAAKKTPPPASPVEEEPAEEAPAPATEKSPAPSPDADAAADEGEDVNAAADLTSEKETSGSVNLGVKLGLVIGLAALVAVAGQ